MRFADRLKSLTVIACIAICTAAPPAAQAQINITIGNGAGKTNQNLPPTNLDSFVFQAGGAADMIYGDESTGLPPLYGFTAASRIDAGINGVNAAGLTTGHGSYMPCAWGGDEFIGQEWCMSGNGSGEIGTSALDAADLLEASIGIGTDLFTIGLQAMMGGSGSGGGLGSLLGATGGVGVSVDGSGVDISGGGQIGNALGGISGGFSTGFGF